MRRAVSTLIGHGSASVATTALSVHRKKRNACRRPKLNLCGIEVGRQRSGRETNNESPLLPPCRATASCHQISSSMLTNNTLVRRFHPRAQGARASSKVFGRVDTSQGSLLVR